MSEAMKPCAHKSCQRIATHFLHVAGFRFPVCSEHVNLPEHRRQLLEYPGAQPIAEIEQFPEEVCPTIVRPKEWMKQCKHYQMEVDAELRTVECGSCGKILDPVQCLIELAAGFRTTDYKLEASADYERKQLAEKQRYHERQFTRKLKDSNLKPLPPKTTRES